MGNLTKVTDPLGDATGFAYDAVDRVTGSTDAAGHHTGYDYDDADRIRSISGPGPDTRTSYEHNPDGQLTARTDPNGHTSSYGYYPDGRPASSTDPLGRQTGYDYDAEGHLTRIVTPGPGGPADNTIADSYDILGRLVGRDMAGGGTVYAYGYDADSRLTSLADPGGLRTRTFDSAGRLTSDSREGRTFHYGYDSDGNLVSRDRPDGTVLEAEFDAADRLARITAHGGPAGSARAPYTFGYDPAGRLARTSGPQSGGLVTERSYDRAGRLSELDSSTRPAPWPTTGSAMTRWATRPASPPRAARQQAMAFGYDDASRLTTACYGASNCADSPPGR
ncbi:hypothetical protein GXW82_17955 [Streptacidiphilus sp. 4-A2]|nr:hypothetical protein [Streptacidiphilus sp. 4-A2]